MGGPIYTLRPKIEHAQERQGLLFQILDGFRFLATDGLRQGCGHERVQVAVEHILREFLLRPRSLTPIFPREIPSAAISCSRRPDETVIRKPRVVIGTGRKIPNHNAVLVDARYKGAAAIGSGWGYQFYFAARITDKTFPTVLVVVKNSCDRSLVVYRGGPRTDSPGVERRECSVGMPDIAVPSAFRFRVASSYSALVVDRLCER